MGEYHKYLKILGLQKQSSSVIQGEVSICILRNLKKKKKAFLA